jgi:signal transduction histidine kinase
VFVREAGLVERVGGKRISSVAIEISDTGSGIPPEDIPKAMDPFFTTKPEGKGTGLGLPICRRIVEEHGGEFRIESTVGIGTTIYIDLPVPETNTPVKWGKGLEGS